MHTDNGQTRSVWMTTADTAPAPALTMDTTADVCVVGAGIAGLTTAYLLARAGHRVVVLDDGPVAGGETCRTTAHISNALDDRYVELEKLFGEDGARLAAASHTAAIDTIEDIARAERIDCDFERVDGYLYAPPGEDRDLLARELAAGRRAGLDLTMVERAPVDGFDTGACIRFPNQGQFHPVRYMRGLADAFERAGGRLFGHTHAHRIEGGAAARVEASSGHAVSASRAVVVATNSPVNDLVAIHTKQAGYRTYVIGARVPQGRIPHVLLWDTLDPYHYVRLQPLDDSYDVLIVGGEDHKTGQADDMDARYARLETWTRERFPATERVEYRWSGQVMEPVDGLAFIGRNPLDADNVFVATGDSGNGITHGTIAGLLLTDLISGRENPWAGIYDPSRKSLRSIKRFAAENLNVAAQYADYLTAGDVSSLDRIAPGTGAVLRRGLSKVAVYRDESGALHERSAICPHLGCVVAWNSGERTWDCPCHASRFATDGHVVNGPAITGLGAAGDDDADANG